MRRFHEHQEQAKQNSVRLVLLMGIMQVLTVALSGLVFGYLYAAWELLGHWEDRDAFSFVQALLTGALFVMPCVAMLIAVCSLWKFYRLRKGGSEVARMLRAVLIEDATDNSRFRRLLNTVEELAVSSGLPVPPVYVMYGEKGINALAAGYRPQDAVIVVTEGCVNRLNRDQLQGVMAHEFSHILNGDIARNMWLMAFTHGNYCIILTAQSLIEGDPIALVGPEKAPLLFSIPAYLLWALGLLGAFLAMLFTALIKREDEFMADATAVELTRLPDGLSEALRLIGGNKMKGRVRCRAAFGASHLFFADSGWSLMRWLDPHPPLDERIIRLHPEWDGYYLFEQADEIGEYIGAYHEVAEMLHTERRSSKPMALAAVAAAVVIDHGSNSADNEGDLPEWPADDSDCETQLVATMTEIATNEQGAALVLAGLRLDQIEETQSQDLLKRIDTAVAAGFRQIQPGLSRLTDAEKLALFDF